MILVGSPPSSAMDIEGTWAAVSDIINGAVSTGYDTCASWQFVRLNLNQLMFPRSSC